MEQQQSASTSQTDHVLGLKVMRLTKPHLMAPPFSMGEPWDPIGRALESESNRDVRVGQYAPGIGISEMLELPSTNTPAKGNLIYLGETYRVFVSLSNEGQEVLLILF